MPNRLDDICESCEFRSRCIRYGWMSPGQMWFPDVVMLCPVEGCRRFALSLETLRRHFTPGDAGEDAAVAAEPGPARQAQGDA